MFNVRVRDHSVYGGSQRRNLALRYRHRESRLVGTWRSIFNRFQPIRLCTMKHEFIKIISVDVLCNYSLRLHFDNGAVKEIDLEPVLYGELYEPLRDPDFFRQVMVDDEVGTIVWPNGADFDSDLLYMWDEHGKAFASQINQIFENQVIIIPVEITISQ
jgi:hypothetical protein